MELAVVLGREPASPAGVLCTHRRQVAALSAALAGRGHDVVVYLTGADVGLDEACRERALRAGVRIETGPAEAAPGVFTAFLADRWSSRLPTLVYATGTASGVCAVEAAGTRPVPLVADARGAAAPRGERAAVELFTRAHRVLAVSTDHAANLARSGITQPQLAVIPYGLISEAMSPNGNLRRPREIRTLLCPDGPASADGAADVLRALAWLPDAELVVVGGPEPGDVATDPDARGLRELAEKADLTHRVYVLGRLDEPELRLAYADADVVVTVPRRPGPGLTCLEAMACGACVVASAVGGARDAVLPGITGLLVPPGQPRALARALRGLLGELTMMASWGFAAADRARSRYGWNQLAQESDRVFLDAARAGGYWPEVLAGGSEVPAI